MLNTLSLSLSPDKISTFVPDIKHLVKHIIAHTFAWQLVEMTFHAFTLLDKIKKEPYETKEKIGLLTPDSLSLVVKEANPRLAFLYLNTKIIKERVKVESDSQE